MKHQLKKDRLAHGTALFRWPPALVRAVTMVAHEFYAELRRLNRGGNQCGAQKFHSRREQAAAFKAALAHRFREHNRCC